VEALGLVARACVDTQLARNSRFDGMDLVLSSRRVTNPKGRRVELLRRGRRAPAAAAQLLREMQDLAHVLLDPDVAKELARHPSTPIVGLLERQGKRAFGTYLLPPDVRADACCDLLLLLSDVAPNLRAALLLGRRAEPPNLDVADPSTIWPSVDDYLERPRGDEQQQYEEEEQQEQQENKDDEEQRQAGDKQDDLSAYRTATAPGTLDETANVHRPARQLDGLAVLDQERQRARGQGAALHPLNTPHPATSLVARAARAPILGAALAALASALVPIIFNKLAGNRAHRQPHAATRPAASRARAPPCRRCAPPAPRARPAPAGQSQLQSRTGGAATRPLAMALTTNNNLEIYAAAKRAPRSPRWRRRAVIFVVA
jgi:hypothetical protein